MIVNDYRIQVTLEAPNKYLAKVLKQTGDDQREGPSYDVLSAALGSEEADAIYDAVNEAFSDD